MPIYSFVSHYQRMLEAVSTLGLEQAFLRYCYQTSPDFWQAVLEVSGKQTLKDVKDRIQKMAGRHYRDALKVVQNAQVEERIKTALDTSGKLLPLKEEPEVYLAFGFGSVAAGGIFMDGRPAIYFGLEFFENPELLDKVTLWTAHEYSHVVRWERRGTTRNMLHQTPVKEKLVFEGLAIDFSELSYPGHPLSFYLNISDEQLRWLKAHEKQLWREITPLLEDRIDPEIHRRYFDSTSSGWLADGTPHRRGYYLGYHLIQKALKHPGKKHISELHEYTFEQLWSFSQKSRG